MKPKIIKSKQVYVEAFGVQCTCGHDFDSCMEMDSWYSSDELGSLWECEGCGQQWKMPKNVQYMVVKFKRGEEG